MFRIAGALVIAAALCITIGCDDRGDHYGRRHHDRDVIIVPERSRHRDVIVAEPRHHRDRDRHVVVQEPRHREKNGRKVIVEPAVKLPKRKPVVIKPPPPRQPTHIIDRHKQGNVYMIGPRPLPKKKTNND